MQFLKDGVRTVVNLLTAMSLIELNPAQWLERQHLER